jgi:hypothetical protein
VAVLGSYALCWLDDLYIGSSKNDIDNELIALFRQQDRIIQAWPISDLPSHLKHYRESLEEDPELKVIYFETPVNIVRDRLELFGYDLSTAKMAFCEWIAGEQKRAYERLDELGSRDVKTKDLLQEHYQKTCKILSELTPEIWIESLKQIHASGLKTNYIGRYEGPHEDTVIGYMLSNNWYGYPGYDLYVPLRLALEAFEDGQRLLYDLTDLVWSGYFDYGDDFVEFGIRSSASEYIVNSKTIVLTEGKTDAWILEEALSFLYPHLKDYFSFLDFENSGFGGGVGNLVNVVKAFAGSGIVNNVIALFDNDTAAIAVIRSLKNIEIPANIAVCTLPEYALLRNYPTIGPSGCVNWDVNGIAASIELYLGEDVLRIDGKKLVPIQWTGYEKSLNQYQGEVLEKAQLQTRFRKKLKCAQNGEALDWTGLQAVFKLLFTAFSERNRKAICGMIDEYYSY